MSDPMVLATQQWVNATFGSVPGYTPCNEDGLTGTATVNCLIMGLQHVLGISPVVPSFGPTTWSDLQAAGDVLPGSPVDMIKVMQGAMYCKGYDGSALSGVIDSRTIAGVKNLQTDMGYTGSAVDGITFPKLFRFLLNTDPAVLIAGGNPIVRAAQQWVNLQYIGRQNFFFSSASGVFDRNTQLNLVYGMQYELGLSDAVANGSFGPTTQADLKATPASIVTVSSTDSSSHWVHLFKAALAYNRFYPSAFNGTFSTGDAQTTTAFQQFSGFTTADATGTSTFATWAELLVSTGDPTRVGRGLDCASTVTSARASSLVAAGYQVVGRYLTNEQVASPLDKKIKPGEITTILGAGLRLFPIFEEGGYVASWFTQAQGQADAARAVSAALAYGFPSGTTIYFAVDFDATDANIDISGTGGTVGVLAYFRGVQNGMRLANSPYPIGVYGARHVCSRVCAEGSASSSYVGGLSTGWSGNLGFPLPNNWAFNQVQTLTVGSGSGAIQIDKDIVSGRNLGVSSMATPIEPNTAAFQYLAWLQARAHDFNALGSTGQTDSQLVCQYLRLPDFTGVKWDVFAGVIFQDWVDYVNGFNVPVQTILIDPQYNVAVGTEHLFGCIGGVLFSGAVQVGSTSPEIFMGDFVGWAGDLLQLMRAYIDVGSHYASATAFAQTYINNPDPTLVESDFGQVDLIQDVSGYVLAAGGPSANIATTVQAMFSITGTFTLRFKNFVDERFGSQSALLALAQEVCTGSDLALEVIRNQFAANMDSLISASDRNAIAAVFASKVWAIAYP